MRGPQGICESHGGEKLICSIVTQFVFQAVVRVGKRALRNNVMLAVAAAAFVAIFLFQVPFPLIILAAGVIGFLGGRAGIDAFIQQRPPKSKKPPSRRGLFASKRRHHNWQDFAPPRWLEIAPPLTQGRRSRESRSFSRPSATSTLRYWPCGSAMPRSGKPTHTTPDYANATQGCGERAIVEAPELTLAIR